MPTQPHRIRMTSCELTLRTAQAGDHDWIVAAHGEVYAAEFGFDSRFQDRIAAQLRAFLQLPGPFNRVWVGWAGDARAGSIAISHRPGQLGSASCRERGCQTGWHQVVPV